MHIKFVCCALLYMCIYIYISLIAVLPWEIAMILQKLLNAHLCTCCFLKDALGETPRVRQIWTLSVLKNKPSHSMWDRHPDNPSVCGLCKHCLCLHELQKSDYYLFFRNMKICWDACHSYSVYLQWPQKCLDTHTLHMRFTHYTYYYMFSDLPLQGLNIRQVIYYSLMVVSKHFSV